MGLPKHNPIDTEWLSRGTPIDHIGTRELYCKACGHETKQEGYKVIVGNVVAVGTPFFVRPFKKSNSTGGVFGGVSGLLSQCTVCDSLWPFNQDGKAVLMKLGLPQDGLVNPDHSFDAGNRRAEAEKSGVLHAPDGPGSMAQSSSTSPAPGWHPDPYGRFSYRYWDGQWTSTVSSNGRTYDDAPE